MCSSFSYQATEQVSVPTMPYAMISFGTCFESHSDCWLKTSMIYFKCSYDARMMSAIRPLQYHFPDFILSIHDFLVSSDVHCISICRTYWTPESIINIFRTLGAESKCGLNVMNDFTQQIRCFNSCLQLETGSYFCLPTALTVRSSLVRLANHSFVTSATLVWQMEHYEIC
jgi:hypothetical protein